MENRSARDLTTRRGIPLNKSLFMNHIGDLDRCERAMQAGGVKWTERLCRKGVCDSCRWIVPLIFACLIPGQLSRKQQCLRHVDFISHGLDCVKPIAPL